MKAILIVDLNNDTDLSSEADVIIENGDFRLETKAYLKPLPEHKDLYEEEPTMMFIKGSAVDSFACGWNACLDEILGNEYE